MSQRGSDWINNTPSVSYTLVAMPSHGSEVLQELELTVHEFDGLKHHLAATRGHGYAEQMEAFRSEGSPFGGPSDEQQLAMHLDDAKLFYKLYPALIMGPYPEGWKELLPDNNGKKDLQQPQRPAAETHQLTAEVLDGLSKTKGKFLDDCLKIVQEWNGFTSPAEDFLKQLILLNADERITPDVVVEQLEEFRENLEQSTAIVRKLLRDYPELVKAGAE